MPPEKPSTDTVARLIEASGLRHLVYSPATHLQLGRMATAFAGIVLTVLLAIVLDYVWTTTDQGVAADSVERCVFDHPALAARASPKGDNGVGEVFWAHERQAGIGLIVSIIPGLSSFNEGPVGGYIQQCTAGRSPLDHLSRLVGGVWWMLRHHALYFFLCGLGCLAIWATCGGIVCRLSAVQFARGEAITWDQAVRFCRTHAKSLIGTPTVPAAFCALCGVVLLVFGLFMRIPWIGDLIGGLLLPMATLMGLIIALMLLGTAAGAPLFLPAVVVGGEDPFTAFSLAMSYTFLKPWKTLWYALVNLVYAGLSWLALSVTAWAALSVTRSLLSLFGSSALGGARGAGEKITSLWPMDGPLDLFSWPMNEGLTGYDQISAFFIALFMLVVTGIVWSYMVSLFFHAATVSFLLLRRDVDGTDLEEILADGPAGAAATERVATAVSP